MEHLRDKIIQRICLHVLCYNGDFKIVYTKSLVIDTKYSNIVVSVFVYTSVIIFTCYIRAIKVNRSLKFFVTLPLHPLYKEQPLTAWILNIIYKLIISLPNGIGTVLSIRANFGNKDLSTAATARTGLGPIFLF